MTDNSSKFLTIFLVMAYIGLEVHTYLDTYYWSHSDSGMFSSYFGLRDGKHPLSDQQDNRNQEREIIIPFMNGPEGLDASFSRFTLDKRGYSIPVHRAGVERYMGRLFDFSRRDQIKEMMVHAWQGYYKATKTTMRHATLSNSEKKRQVPDELKPLSHRADYNWYGIGLTAFDSLSTLHAMGLEEEYHQARGLVLMVCDNTFHPEAWVQGSNRGVHESLQLNVFESNIRHMGALLSVYGETKDKALLECAKHLGDLLLSSFDTVSGFAHHQVTLTKGVGGFRSKPEQEPWMQQSMVLAEMGSLQLEFRYLSEYTGDAKYAKAVNRFTERLQEMRVQGWPSRKHHYAKDARRSPHIGLFNIYHHQQSRQVHGKISMGGFGDSFYEYLLKQWIAFGKQDEHLATMYEDAVEGMMLHLVKYAGGGRYAVVTALEPGTAGQPETISQDHLACFVGGMLAQGVAAGVHRRPGRRPRTWGDKEIDRLARDTTLTCLDVFNSPTGLGPEEVTLKGTNETDTISP